MEAAFSFDFPAAGWKKSSACQADNTCVEIARISPQTMGARDSKRGDLSPVLQFSPEVWQAFLDRVKSGELDLA